MPGYGDMGYKVPQSADINTSSTLAVIIAADPDATGNPGTGSGFRITALVIQGNGAGAITLQSDATVKAHSTMKAGDDEYTLPYNPDGWFEIAKGEAFKIGNGSALTLVGVVTYIKTGGASARGGTA